MIAAREVIPERDEGGEPTAPVIPLAIAPFFLGKKLQDHEVPATTGQGFPAEAIALCSLEVEEPARQPEAELMGSPIGYVEKRIEVPLHPEGRVPFEVPPLVVVREAGGRDGGAR